MISCGADKSIYFRTAHKVRPDAEMSPDPHREAHELMSLFVVLYLQTYLEKLA